MTPEFDPERKLWVPGRRKFFFGLGALAVASALPAVANPCPFQPDEMVRLPKIGWDMGRPAGQRVFLVGVRTASPARWEVTEILDEPGQLRALVRRVW